MTSVSTVPVDVAGRHARRAARFEARYVLWGQSSLKRVRACGRFTTSDSGAVVRVSGSTADGSRLAGLGGVQSCGSVWACPVCAQKIQAERQAQVSSALAVARHRGWEVLFLTLTMRHAKGHALKRLWEHLATAWRATTSGSGGSSKGQDWKDDKTDYGIQGYIRLVEVTHGHENGWHVHAHVLLFVDPSKAALAELDHNGAYWLTDDQVTDLGGRMFGRWKSALNFRGIRPSARRGVDIKRVRSDDCIAEYFAKNMYDRKGEGSTAHDVTGSHSKEAKNGNRTPFGILRGIVDVETGLLGEDVTPESSERDLALWQTFEAASKGRRQLLWSKGLKSELGVDVDDKTDQEIVDEEHGGEVLDWLSPSEWKYISKRRWQAQLLDAAEADDTGEALCAFLVHKVRTYKPDL